MISSDFKKTWLWRHAFVNPQTDVSSVEQEYFRDQYLLMREKVAVLASRIVVDLPSLTVHDITHLDALWETASIVAEGAITINPAEAFVFGAAVLLHDAAMSLAAFPNGLTELMETTIWKDTLARIRNDEEPPCKDVVDGEMAQVLPEVLRRLHADRAAELAGQAWFTSDGESVFLIGEVDLRQFYGQTIGLIATSHWWQVERIERELNDELGAFSGRTRSRIDRIKLACLLRIADALHLDQRRAPRFLRALLKPSGASALHWSFQEKLATPHVEVDSIVFTSGASFTLDEAESWWLAYDTMTNVDRELRDVDLLLQSRSREVLKARRVKGVGAPEHFARLVPTRGWRPVDTQLRVSDIPKIINTLGGAKLYGEDPTVALREIIQNSADAIQARRRLQGRGNGWGSINISLIKRDDHTWLSVEDNGVGMSEQVLTGPLIDFGVSLWKSALATEEFPGLLSKGMNSVGHFGIGFFSVFMLGSIVKVTSRRYDRAEETARVLEFRDGTLSRPILYPAPAGIAPMDGGTRIEILLKSDPTANEGLLGAKLNLAQVVGAIAPNVEATITATDDDGESPVVSAGDWLDLREPLLLQRLDPFRKDENVSIQKASLMRCMKDDEGRVFGRGFIQPTAYFCRAGCITVGGLRATRISNIEGVLIGDGLTAARDSALPSVPPDVLATWASEQAQLISASNLADDFKAECAEVVLECGGSISNLPIACWGGEWLDTAALAAKFEEVDDVMVNFNGNFEYDEYADSVHPRDFKDFFEVDEDVVMVPKHSGSVINVNRKKWPSMITGKSLSSSNLAILLLEVVKKSFRPTSEATEERNVGDVNGTAIFRQVTVFRREDDEEELQTLLLPKNSVSFDLF